MTPRIIAFDTETYPFYKTGKATKDIVPRLVCLSWADGTNLQLLERARAVPLFMQWLLDGDVTFVGLNLAFDLLVMARALEEEYPEQFESTLWPLLYNCSKWDIGTESKLFDISCGGMFLRGRYNLAALVKRWLGEEMTGKKLTGLGPDVWRMRYNELDGEHTDNYPEAAYAYALNDADVTYRVFAKLQTIQNPNRSGTPIRSQYAFDFQLMSAWGLRVDGQWVRAIKTHYTKEMLHYEALLSRPSVPMEEDVLQAVIQDGKKKSKVIQAVILAAWLDIGEAPTLTPTGKIKTDAKVMKYLESKGVQEPIFQQYSRFNRSQKFLSTYVEPLIDAEDGPICPRYSELMDTGRSSACIAQGTPIATLDSKGTGKPIEDVRAGDWVWAFDDEGLPCIKQVEWAAKTGHKAVVRVYFQSQGKRTFDFFDCTPEHLVRKVDGSWCRADALTSDDHVMAISRGTKKGYTYAYATGGFEFREHRFAYEQIHGITPEHVHHINHVKDDNRPENLEGLTHAAHTSLHAQGMPASQADVLIAWRKKATPDELEASVRRGPHHQGWLGLSYREIMEGLLRHAGKPLRYAQAEGIDYATLQSYMKREGISFKDVRAFFNGNDQYMDQAFVEKHRAQCHVAQPDRLKDMGLGFYRWKQIQEAYGFVPHNHRIMRVEVLPGTVDVYDLHVPGSNCFIANEVCVHNSGPNVQNFPSRINKQDKALLAEWNEDAADPDAPEEEPIDRLLAGFVTGPDLRGAIIPREGCVFVAADYTAAEMAGLAQTCQNIFGYAGTLAKAINAKLDLHLYVAAKLLGCSYKEVEERYNAKEPKAVEMRQISKIANFGFAGGASAKTFIDYAAGYDVKITLKVAEAAKAAWLDAWTEMPLYFRYIKQSQSSRGSFHIEQHGPNRMTSGWRLRVTGLYTQAANTGFQGIVADGAIYALHLIVKACYTEKDSVLYGSRPLLFIHDEIIIESPEDKAEECATELSRLMVLGLKKFLPDMLIIAEPTIMKDRWSK